MSVRAKFEVAEIRRHQYANKEMQTVCLVPVRSNDSKHENAKFWNATPSGKIELGIINLEAAEYFELGKEYYLDFTLADK